MTKQRRTYTREFKVEAVRLVTEEGYSIREAAESLGISGNSLRVWRKELVREADEAFPGKGAVSLTQIATLKNPDRAPDRALPNLT